MHAFTPVRKRFALLGVIIVVASGCLPTFWGGSSLQLSPGAGTDVRLIWNTAYDAEFDNGAHLIIAYEVKVNGTVVNNDVSWADADCTLTGLASNTAYFIEVVARTTSGERSDSLPPALGTLSANYTTPVGSNPGGTITCVTDPNDPDGDRLPNWAETNTGVFVSKTNAGTNPNNPDTDGDGINDGDEVVGSVDGLPLPLMGANPLKKNVFMEFDWLPTDASCGSGFSYQPTAAVINRFEQSFANAPVSNPDGSTGIDVISDYGQTPLSYFNKGNLVSDAIAPIGSVNGGVNDAEYTAIKAANFHPSREGFFHYTLMMHRYNTNSGSSGQAEILGDDLIVSLQCFNDVNWLSNTIMHELGHNLGLLHGGDTSAVNYKPNYNSVMNYAFQFGGVDADGAQPGGCDRNPDQIIDYSNGDRVALNENAVDENIGVCGFARPDWNGNGVLDPPYVRDLNADALFTILTDYNDWANVNFGAVVDGDGAQVGPPELIDEQPVPIDPPSDTPVLD
jgi:hypothetical protein